MKIPFFNKENFELPKIDDSTLTFSIAVIQMLNLILALARLLK